MCLSLSLCAQLVQDLCKKLQESVHPLTCYNIQEVQSDILLAEEALQHAKTAISVWDCTYTWFAMLQIQNLIILYSTVQKLGIAKIFERFRECFWTFSAHQDYVYLTKNPVKTEILLSFKMYIYNVNVNAFKITVSYLNIFKM